MGERIASFARRHDRISAAYLFGSMATGATHPQSDIDIAFLLDGQFDDTEAARLAADYAIELEDLLSRPVDVVILNTASPMLRHQVFRKGKLLFARDPRRLRRFIGDAVVEYLDEIVLIERLQKRSIRRLTGGR